MGRHLLEHFVILVEHTARSVDHADVVVTVGAVHGAGTPFKAHKADIHVSLAVGRVQSRGQRTQQVVPTGGHPVRDHRCQCPDDGVGIGRTQVVAESGRLGVTGVEDGALWDDDLDRLDHTLVVRNVRIDHLQESEDGG